MLVAIELKLKSKRDHVYFNPAIIYWLCSRPCFILFGWAFKDGTPLGTAPTIRTWKRHFWITGKGSLRWNFTLVTCRLSLNWGGGATTNSSLGKRAAAWLSLNSGGGGKQKSSFSSFSFSIGGGNWARDIACLFRRPVD